MLPASPLMSTLPLSNVLGQLFFVLSGKATGSLDGYDPQREHKAF